MRRTRRAAAPDVAPEETAQPAVSGPAASEQAAPETTPTDATASATETPAKPIRRRTPRPKSAETPAAVTAAQDADTEAAGETEGAETPPPARRPGGRRRKATEPAEAKTAETLPPAVTPPMVVPDLEAPVIAATEETPARRRGRRRESNPPANAAPVPINAVTADTPTEETAPDTGEAPVTPIEAEAPAGRRPGGRRTRAAVPEDTPLPDLPDVEAPVVESRPAESQTPETPIRRRRRRRGEAVTPAAAPPAAEEEPEAVPAVEPAGEAVTDDAEGEKDGERRGRRSRSRRRRRGGEVELPPDLSEAGDAGLILPEPVSVEEAPDDEDDGSLALIAPPPPVYAAPPLVPPVLAPPSGAALPRVRAALQRPQGGGLPRIGIDGRSHAPFLFFVNAETAASGEVVDSQIREAAAAGVHLYSGVMYLPLRNAYGDRSFGATDALVQQILGADPDAYILPRLQFVTTNYWARTHPDQMARYADGSEGDVSLASTGFWADCVDALEALISHFADPATPGGDRVIGFQLDRGEWFYDQTAGHDLSEPNRLAFQNWLRGKYQQTYALRAAWYSGSATFDDAEIPAWPGATAKAGDTPLYSGPRDGRWPDYALFSSDLVAQAITGLAEAVKTLSEGRLLVGVSYGYTLEFASRSDSGHLALGRVLDSPHIDILAGPNSYAGRGAGSVGGFGAPIDSVALHGKLWLVEDDTKTFLATEDTPDDYNPKIVGGADTQAAHERHFGAALAHRAGVTWMDLWGQGWLDSPDIWRALGRLRDQADRLSRVSDTPMLTPDVVVFVDEASLAYFKNDPAGLGQSLVAKSRDLLLRSGASVGFYLQSDVHRDDLPDAKLYLFLNALRVTAGERRAIRGRLHKPGKTLAWLYAPGLFDEQGLAEQEIGDTVGMALRQQPWNCRGGSQLTDARSVLTDRLRTVKRGLGQDDVLNPSFAVTDPQATVLAEYTQTGAASLAVREQPGGWKSVFIGDPHLTNELLRGLYTYANVPVYETQDDVVYAGEGVLLIHAPFTGQRTITLPRRATVYDVGEDKIIATQTRSFRVFLRARTTRLFLWGEAGGIADATGLTPPATSQGAAEPMADQDDASPQETVNRPPPLRTRTPVPEPAPESFTVADFEDDTVAAPVSGAEIAGAMDVLEDAILPLLDGDESDEETAADTNGTEPAASARRSRWQRRRAAMRARRDAERLARAAGEGTPEGGTTPPLDISTLLPDLPPRRKASEITAPSEDEE